MAPEIFDDHISPKSDVWALGVIAYELFCGKKPFGVNPFEVHGEVCDEDPVDVSPVLKVGGSQIASRFVSRLLTKDEKLRPTAQEAQTEFHEWLDIGPPKAKPLALTRSSLTNSLNEFRAT